MTIELGTPIEATPSPHADALTAARQPVTESQRELWLAAALGPAVNIAFNEGLIWTLRGELDVDALERAVQTIVARHGSLRACFSPDGTTMCVQRHVPVCLAPVSPAASA